MISFTTIGYGDITLELPESKVFFSFTLLLGLLFQVRQTRRHRHLQTYHMTRHHYRVGSYHCTLL